MPLREKERFHYLGGSVVDGVVLPLVPPDAPVPGAQLGSLGVVVELQSMVLLPFDPLLPLLPVRPGVCEDVPESARLLLLDVPLPDDAEPAAPLPELPLLIEEHPAASAAIAIATIAIPD